MGILTALWLIAFEAVPEGLAMRGGKYKTIAGVIEFLYRAVVALILFLGFTAHESEFVYTIIGYVLLRYAIFDLVFNLCAGLAPLYVGKTKLSDKLFQWFFRVTRIPAGFFLGSTKFVMGVWGFAWLMGWQHGIQ